MFSCSEGDNPVSGSSEIDVDWVLIKTLNMSQYSEDWEQVVGTGYYFYFINYPNTTVTDLSIEIQNVESGPHNIIFENNDGVLSFSYNGENFSFDLSDSYNSTLDQYYINTEFENIERIIYNEDINYFTIIGNYGSLTMNSSTPKELIDYR